MHTYAQGIHTDMHTYIYIYAYSRSFNHGSCIPTIDHLRGAFGPFRSQLCPRLTHCRPAGLRDLTLTPRVQSTQAWSVAESMVSVSGIVILAWGIYFIFGYLDLWVERTHRKGMFVGLFSGIVFSFLLSELLLNYHSVKQGYTCFFPKGSLISLVLPVGSYHFPFLGS